MSEKPKRFCAEIEIDGHFLKGCGTTLAEARENLIKEIERNELLFPPEKTQLIKQIREFSQGEWKQHAIYAEEIRARMDANVLELKGYETKIERDEYGAYRLFKRYKQPKEMI